MQAAASSGTGPEAEGEPAPLPDGPQGHLSPGTVDRRHAGGVRILVLEGEHDVSTVQRLARELEDAHDAGVGVVVDLTSVGFLDSSILRTLVDARERALGTDGRGCAIVAPPGSFASRVLALVVGTLIPTHPDVTAGLASLGVSGS